MQQHMYHLTSSKAVKPTFSPTMKIGLDDDALWAMCWVLVRASSERHSRRSPVDGEPSELDKKRSARNTQHPVGISDDSAAAVHPFSSTKLQSNEVLELAFDDDIGEPSSLSLVRLGWNGVINGRFRIRLLQDDW